MRNEYYDLLNKYKLSDVLSGVDISYSNKIKYLTILLATYEVSIINRALDKYKENYIKIDRVIYIKIYNTIKYYCEKISKEK